MVIIPYWIVGRTSAGPPCQLVPAASGYYGRRCSSEQHAVAVREEAVPFTDGVGIRREDDLSASSLGGEGRHQHQKGRLRKVEVGQEALNQPEVVAGGEKNGGLAGVGFEGLAAREECTVFECASRSGSGSDDAAAVSNSAVESGGRGGGERVVFGVQVYLGKRGGADWLKGAKPNMQREMFNLNVLCAKRREDLGSEVQAGGGGSSGAGCRRVDRLIAGAVFGGVRFILWPMDVGWQRNVTDNVEDCLKVCNGFEAERAFAKFGSGGDLSFEQQAAGVGMVEVEALAEGEFPAGADERRPEVRIKLLSEQHFDAAGRVGRVLLRYGAASAGGIQACRNDAAVIKNKQVAGPQVLR